MKYKTVLVLIFFAAFFFFTEKSFGQADTALTFSEVMFIPVTGNNEFIEIYNLSETDSFNLAGYKFKYATSNPDIIVDAGFGTMLRPLSFAVVFEGDYDIQSGIYNNLVPPDALILKISDNSFGTTGMANTENRQLWILSPSDDTLDTYIYSANNPTARSDEKVILNKDNSASNWANSLTANGTPGGRNSVTPINFDLEVSSLFINPSIVFEGENATVFSVIKNRGINSASEYTIEIFNDADFDSIGTPSELIFFQTYANLLPGDSITANVIMNSLSSGNYRLISKVTFAQDEDTLNNKRIFNFFVFTPGVGYNDVVLNEIMYAPAAGEPEWVELYNKTSGLVNIKNWRFSDNAATVSITNSDKFIEPESFIVLSRDSSILNYYNIPVEIVVFNMPALNNTGDAVVIKDSIGVVIDSVVYFPSWGGSLEGRSLERIAIDDESNLQSNWGTSVSINKATPGIINSITPKEFDLMLSMFKPAFPFGIIGEEINFTIRVSNIGTNTSGNFNLKIYNDVNLDSIPQSAEQIAEFFGNALETKDSIQFNFNNNDFSIGNNYFIAYVETEPDQDTTNNLAFSKVIGVEVNELRSDLIINEFMYAPTSPEPEWIEIYNRSDKTIDLKNYRIADNNDTVTVINESTILNPGDYFIIAANNSILNFYNIPSGIVFSSFPVLNNTGDKIILLDSLNRTIDSLQFTSAWGGTGNRSLERIDSELSSTDSLNWKTSASKNRATPGYINSVTVKDFDLELSGIISSPPFPVFGDDVTISIKIKNVGLNNTQFHIQLFEDTNLDSIPDLFLTEILSLNLQSMDSAVYNTNYTVLNLLAPKGFYAVIIFEQDEDTTNNYLYSVISPGYPSSTIVINEIMYTPSGGEPEWVELFNTTSDSINLKNYTVTDIITTPATATINQDVYIQPNSYLVLTRDSSIFNYHRLIPSPVIRITLPVLNNDTDGVILKDNRGAVMDSIRYFSDWGGTNGYSLERREIESSSNLSSNWESSIDIEQSTPGRINSITPKEFDLSVAEISFEPRFPIAGDNVFISAKIKNNGNQPANNFAIEFFTDTDSNNVVDFLLKRIINLSLGAMDSASFTSSIPVLNLQSGILTAVRVEFTLDEDTLNNYVEKSVEPGFKQNSVLINEVMYDPTGGEPEWFEIVNVSDDTLNLKNWSVSDILTTPTKNSISTDDFHLMPGEFLVMTRDTSILSYHPDIPSKILAVNFGTLGNTSDGIMVYDFRDGIIDSLFYRSNWGGRRGYSLERISLTGATQDSSNWVTSLSENRSTPGRHNSVVNAPDYKRNVLVINEIMFDPDIDNTEFVEFYNSSNDDINVGGWKIEDENKNTHRLSETNIIIPPKDFFILAADSNVIQKYGLHEFQNKNIVGVSTLGLINTGELILLKDLKGNVIDSVWYSNRWHNNNIAVTKNRSLERINPSLNANDPLNWSTAVNLEGATPGKQNSIFTDNLNRESKISVSPNPFSPDNDGYEDHALINYNLTQPVAQVRIKIFDNKGRMVRTVLNNQPSGSTGSAIFDGLDDEGRALRIGIYIIFLEALNDSSGVVETLKTTIVVARKL